MFTTQQRWIIFGVFVFALLLYILSPILTPFLMASLFAYLGDPLVSRLVKWKLPRTLAVILVFMLLFTIILGLILLLIPLIRDQIKVLIKFTPDIINLAKVKVLPFIQQHIDKNFEFNPETIKNTLLANWQQTGNAIDNVLKTITHSGKTLVLFSINLVLVPVVTFYLMRDWPTLVRRISDLIPRKLYPTVSELVKECDEVVGAFFRGQFMVMLSLGIFYTLGLSIIGVDLALLIGIIIAVFSIVPYLGAFVGFTTAVIVTSVQFHDWIHIFYVLLLFGIGHLLEGMVLAPLLIGGRIGLHPVAIIFAVLAGGELFGFFGVLLALPVAAVIMVWLKHLHHSYLNSQLYKKG